MFLYLYRFSFPSDVSLYLCFSISLMSVSMSHSLSTFLSLSLFLCVCQKFCHVEMSGERDMTVGDKLLHVYNRGQEGPTLTYSLNPYSERHKSKLSWHKSKLVNSNWKYDESLAISVRVFFHIATSRNLKKIIQLLS